MALLLMHISVFAALLLLAPLAAARPGAIASDHWDAHPHDRIVIDAAGGAVTLDAQLRGAFGTLIARANNGKLLLRKRLPAYDYNLRSVHLREYHIAQLNDPLVLFTFDGPAADGTWVFAWLYIVRADRVDEVVNTSAVGRLEDDICIGRLGSPARSGVVVAEHLQDNEAAIGPHRYRATVYSWRRGKLEHSNTYETARMYDSFAEAQKELPLTCRDRLAEVVVGQ
jgi:hypothetical protein